ncbi:MAG: serine--tRNA ligase [Bacteroidota bacterium]
MLQISRLRNDRKAVLAGLAKRQFPEAEASIDQLLQLDDQRRSLQTQLDNMLAERNQLSKQVGSLFKQGKQEEANAIREQVNELKTSAAQTEEQLTAAKQQLQDLLVKLPNVPQASVPAGVDEADNEVYQEHEGELPQLGEGAKPHWELNEEFRVFDLELGVRTTGSGFPLFVGQGARLQRGLINYFLDRATAAGYTEYVAPLLVNEATAFGTGSLPDKEGQMYYVGADDFYLIPTAEVPLTNIYRDQILNESDFPIKLTGYTPCFRREAGSYGAHVRGLNRVHQFDKVEIVQIAHPEQSNAIHLQMLDQVASLLKELELPFRILRLCGGDLTFASALTYDFEVWSAAQQRWLEVSSVSNFETFQSNRMKLRYRGENGTQLAHTLNGSALALPRIIAALMENNQTADGIMLPKVLHPYVGLENLSRV